MNLICILNFNLIINLRLLHVRRVSACVVVFQHIASRARIEWGMFSVSSQWYCF